MGTKEVPVEYLCIGQGRQYLIEAYSPAIAVRKAGALYAESIHGILTSTTYSKYFFPKPTGTLTEVQKEIYNRWLRKHAE